MASLVGALYAVAVWVWIQYLPGWTISVALVPDARGAERQGLALLCGFSTFPFAVFLAAAAAGAPVDGMAWWLSASLINVAGAISMRKRLRGPQSGRARSLAIPLLALSALALFCAVTLLFAVRSLDGGDVFATVQHCLYVIVMHTVGNDPSVAVELYDAVSDGPMHFLVHHPTTEFNGLAPLFYEQRLGNAAILAPAVALLGTTGWYVTAVFASVVYGACGYLAGRVAGARPVAAAIAALAFVWATRQFGMYLINENHFAVALVSFLLWSALRPGLSAGWLILVGITCGHLVGVRYTSSLFWPAVAVAVWWAGGTRRDRWIRIAQAGGPALLTTLPWLYVNWIMLGKLFSHPKLDSAYTDRIVDNTLFGMTFSFRALNWPFTDQVVRTAWNPFPTFVLLPLWIAKCYGQALAAVGMMGWVVAATQKRRTLVLLLLFIVPHTLAMGLLESLDWEQFTYSTPGFVPLCVVLALGLDALWPGPLQRRHLAIAAVMAGVLVGGSLTLRHSVWPADQRLLRAEDWPTLPAGDAGTRAVAKALTSVSPLPHIPPLQRRFAALTARSLGALIDRQPVPDFEGIPTYPSGQLAILAGYAARTDNNYVFAMSGRELRTADDPVRTGIGLHTLTLSLPAEEIIATVMRDDGNYRVDLRRARESTEVRDFTLFLNTWSPSARSMNVTLDGVAIDGLRTLRYGGEAEFGEQHLLVTNYARDVVDLVELTLDVDSGSEITHCGLVLFTRDVDTERVETLIVAGGHATSWTGEATVKVPRG
ncbi:MAG: hypothetical protein ACI9WU_004648, partial [Myxococcota bacterium]